jgi:hypothetical protein
MKKSLQFLTSLGALLFAGALSGQNIQLTLRYNIPQARYEVYARPDASNPSFTWGTSQISVVTPASVPDMALVVTSVNAGSWIDNSRIYAPAAQAANDFHGVGSSEAPVNLVANTEILIFHFTLPGGGCTDGLRLFINGTDPNSEAAGMGGGDFSNTIDNGMNTEVYTSNYDNTGTSCFPDTDGDSVTDNIDNDDDNDGILDTVEDASACAITVSASGTDADCDGDGTPNRLDLDSDGDGINDAIEAGGTDPDNDGRVGSGAPTVDVNGVPTSGALTPPNSDNAAGADPYDLDSDGDSIPDGIEDTDKDGVVDAGETDPKDTDTDNDGINDGIEDTDKDGVVDADETDPSDTDTDNDNIPDGIEDTDKDGVVDAGETDPRDADTDNDGLNDGVEDADQDGIVDSTETDPSDADTDNDGLTDKEEKDNVDDPSTALVPAGTSDPLNVCDPITASSADADSDGLTDCEETTGQDNSNTPANPNGNTSNPNDSDTDNDGLNDGAEGTNGSNPNISDTDGDGLSDNEEVTGIDDPSTLGNPNGNTSSPSNSDTDGDGLNDCDESAICVPNGTPTSTLFGNTHVASGVETGLFGVVSLQGVSTTDRSSSYGAFSFTKMVSWVNASDANHINGYVKKYGATPFTFPVGDNGAFRPVSMSGFATSGQTATAAYFAAAPVSPSALGTGVSAVSAVEYWDIDGTAATRLTLTWDAASNVTALTGSTLSALTILGWNGSQWVAIPSTVAATTLDESSACSEFTATAGTLTVGAITTDAALNPGTYQYYTLGVLSAKLNVKVLLQGALFDTATPGIMRDDLRSGAHLPLNDPYTGSGNARFTHYGTGALATTTNTVLNANAGTNDAIVDWVLVELRSSANSATIVETRAALVQKDGDVVSPSDGTSPLFFNGIAGQSYYVSVKHRNHLGAMTAAAIAMASAGTTVDFTTMTNADLYNQAGYDGAEMVTIGAVKALWAGNANGNTKIKYQGAMNDGAVVLSDVLSHPDNTARAYNFNLGFGYRYGDINMDGKVKYQGSENDPSFIFYNLITAYALNGFDLYNYDLMREQLP